MFWVCFVETAYERHRQPVNSKITTEIAFMTEVC